MCTSFLGSQSRGCLLPGLIKARYFWKKHMPPASAPPRKMLIFFWDVKRCKTASTWFEGIFNDFHCIYPSWPKNQTLRLWIVLKWAWSFHPAPTTQVEVAACTPRFLEIPFFQFASFLDPVEFLPMHHFIPCQLENLLVLCQESGQKLEIAPPARPMVYPVSVRNVRALCLQQQLLQEPRKRKSLVRGGGCDGSPRLAAEA